MNRPVYFLRRWISQPYRITQLSFRVPFLTTSDEILCSVVGGKYVSRNTSQSGEWKGIESSTDGDSHMWAYNDFDSFCHLARSSDLRRTNAYLTPMNSRRQSLKPSAGREIWQIYGVCLALHATAPINVYTVLVQGCTVRTPYLFVNTQSSQDLACFFVFKKTRDSVSAPENLQRCLRKNPRFASAIRTKSGTSDGVRPMTSSLVDTIPPWEKKTSDVVMGEVQSFGEKKDKRELSPTWAPSSFFSPNFSRFWGDYFTRLGKLENILIS